MRVLNIRHLKVGGIHHLTIGRFNFSWSVSRELNKCFGPAPRDVTPKARPAAKAAHKATHKARALTPPPLDAGILFPVRWFDNVTQEEMSQWRSKSEL